MKICPNCKKENEPDAQFCIGCGTRLDVETEPIIAKAKQQVDARLTSVGGWLLFFIIVSLFIATPIMTLIDINEITKMKGLWPEWFIAVLVMLNIGLLILSIYVGIILLMKKRYAPLLAKILLVIMIVINILALFSEDPKDQGFAIRGIITSLIWLAYFFKSKRVKAVYFSEKVELIHKP